MQVIHHGAHRGVTGSCHQLIINEQQSLLVDCGVFQGTDELQGAGSYQQGAYLPAPYQDASDLRGLIITHAHIDHVGRLPELLEAGFNAPIYCTEATALLLPIVMEDALGLTRRDSDRSNQLLLKKCAAYWYRWPMTVGRICNHCRCAYDCGRPVIFSVRPMLKLTMTTAIGWYFPAISAVKIRHYCPTPHR